MAVAFREGLRDLAYAEGQNIAVIRRCADSPPRVSDLATEVVRNNVDVIVAQGTPAAQAAKRATRTIPMVMATSGDPVAVGLIASLARPGATSPGIAFSPRFEWDTARIDPGVGSWCLAHRGTLD